jgi:hypothetical protein
MNFIHHWKKLRLFSILGLVVLTALSTYLLEEYVRRSFVLWVYLLAPTIMHIGCCLFVWGGVHIMSFNDSMFSPKATFQLTWFLRGIVVLGGILSSFSLLELFDLHSGYMPFMFACGTGFLWTSCYYTERISEQAVAPNRSLPPSQNSASPVRGSED